MNPKQSILVGVTGEGENTEALRFALTEARLLRCGITLAHAVHPMLPPPPPSVLITNDTWSDVGTTIVKQAEQELASIAGDDPVPVATAVLHGSAGEVLVELSHEARLVVLQHRDFSPLRRMVTRSTAAAVAAHAHCPVVSVPESPPDDARSRLTVGVHSDGGPRPVLERAFAEASLRGWSVQVLHAWRPTSGDDLLVPADLQWSAQDQTELGAAVEELAVKYPDVDATVDSWHEDAAEAMVKAGRQSAMLVVGRHSGLPVMPRRLGGVARSVVARATCPIMVVPL